LAGFPQLRGKPSFPLQFPRAAARQSRAEHGVPLPPSRSWCSSSSQTPAYGRERKRSQRGIFRSPRHWKFISNHFKPFQTISNHFKPFQTISNQFKPIQTNSNQFKPIQTNSNQFKPIQTNSNQFKPIQTNSNQFSPIQINSNQFKSIQISSNQFNSVQLSSNQFKSTQLAKILYLQKSQVQPAPSRSDSNSADFAAGGMAVRPHF